VPATSQKRLPLLLLLLSQHGDHAARRTEWSRAEQGSRECKLPASRCIRADGFGWPGDIVVAVGVFAAAAKAVYSFSLSPAQKLGIIGASSRAAAAAVAGCACLAAARHRATWGRRARASCPPRTPPRPLHWPAGEGGARARPNGARQGVRSAAINLAPLVRSFVRLLARRRAVSPPAPLRVDSIKRRRRLN